MWLTLGEGGLKCEGDCCIGFYVFPDLLLDKVDNGGALGLSHKLLREEVPQIASALSLVDLPPTRGSFIISQFLIGPFSRVVSLFLEVPSP